jgi:hypothetical protein
MTRLLLGIVLLLSFAQPGIAGTCTCTWNPGAHPSSEKSCAGDIPACNKLCQAKHNPAGISGAVTVSYVGGACTLSKGCKFDAGKSIWDLGYTSGHKANFCLSKGYNRFQPTGNYCWNAECPPAPVTFDDRRKLYDQCIAANQPRCCDHLSKADASSLHICGQP